MAGSVTATFPLGDCVSLYGMIAGIPPQVGDVRAPHPPSLEPSLNTPQSQNLEPLSLKPLNPNPNTPKPCTPTPLAFPRKLAMSEPRAQPPQSQTLGP